MPFWKQIFWQTIYNQPVFNIFIMFVIFYFSTIMDEGKYSIKNKC